VRQWDANFGIGALGLMRSREHNDHL